jgi:hypothetical protein
MAPHVVAGERDGVVAPEPELLGDRHRRDRVVAGDHHHPDARDPRRLDRLFDLRPRRVDHPDHTEVGKPSLCRVAVDGAVFHPPLGHREHPQRLGGHVLGQRQDGRPPRLVERHHPVLGEAVGTEREQHVDGALATHHQRVLALDALPGHHGHALAGAVEGDGQQLFAALHRGVAVDVGLLAEHQQRPLGGVAGELRGHPGAARQRGGVGDHRGQHGLPRRVGERGDLLARLAELPGQVDALAGHVERVAVDHQRAHGHLVAGEGAGLVRADHRGAPEGLHRGELAHHRPALRHALHAQGEGDGGDGREPLGDHRHRDAHRRQQQHVPGDVALHEPDHEERRAQRQGHPQDLRGEVLQPLFQGRLLLHHVGEHLADAAHLGVAAGGDDHAARLAVHHGGAREGHGDLIAHARRLGEHGVGDLLDGGALPGELALDGLQLGHRHQPQVGRDLVPRLEQHQVARHQLPRVGVHDLAATADLAAGGGELHQRVEGLLGLALLIEADEGVDDDDGEDGDGVAEARQAAGGAGLLAHGGDPDGDARGHQQRAHEGVEKLPQDLHHHRGLRRGRQGVGAKLLAQPLHLLAGEASIEVRAAFAHDVFDRHRVP